MNRDTAATTDIRKVGYFIPQRDGTIDFAYGKAASVDVLAELYEIISVISNLQPIIFAFNVVERNYHELLKFIENYRSQLENLAPSNAVIPFSFAITMDGIVTASQTVTNFLSSTSAFLDQTEKRLLRVHGKDSPELTSWHETRCHLHATCFSYRFLYQLRNFAQHRSVPFLSFDIAGERTSENVSMVFKIEILISRDELFNDGFDWSKKLRVEIQQQPPMFDLVPLTTEYLHCLRQLCLEAVKFQNARLAECVHYFDAVCRILKIPEGAVPVIFIGESTKETPPSRYEIIPMEQFKYLIREYGQILRECETQQNLRKS